MAEFIQVRAGGEGQTKFVNIDHIAQATYHAENKTLEVFIGVPNVHGTPMSLDGDLAQKALIVLGIDGRC